jgi:hypothetical protein
MDDPKPRIESSPVVMWKSIIKGSKVFGKINPDCQIAHKWDRQRNLEILNQRQSK